MQELSTTLEARFVAHFRDSAAVQAESLRALLPALSAAAHTAARTLRGGGRVLACGNGGSAAQAQHFAAELSGRFERERRPLAGIALNTDSSALTAIGNDYGFDEVFARQVAALAQPGDCLVAISTSGNSRNVLTAMRAMHERQGHVIALSGRDGGTMPTLLQAGDFELRVPSQITARIQEVHLLLLHCLCDGIDELLTTTDHPAATRRPA